MTLNNINKKQYCYFNKELFWIAEVWISLYNKPSICLFIFLFIDVLHLGDEHTF